LSCDLLARVFLVEEIDLELFFMSLVANDRLTERQDSRVFNDALKNKFYISFYISFFSGILIQL